MSPEIERQQKLGKEVVLRADAALAKPEIYEAEESAVDPAHLPLNGAPSKGAHPGGFPRLCAVGHAETPPDPQGLGRVTGQGVDAP